MNKKFGIGTLILAILLACIMFVSAVSAQENSIASAKPSELQQGLINELNSNQKNVPIDNIVSNYFKANNDKISVKNSGINSPGKYQLKDGSNITFTNQSFSIDVLTTEKLNNSTIQLMDKNSKVAPQWVVPPASTPSLTYTHSLYSYGGVRFLSLTVKGYFQYDYYSVVGHCTDGYYTKYLYFNPWQVTNWEKGAQSISSTQAEVYDDGRFTAGFTIAGNYIEIDSKYIEADIVCDKMGNYYGTYVEG